MRLVAFYQVFPLIFFEFTDDDIKASTIEAIMVFAKILRIFFRKDHAMDTSEINLDLAESLIVRFYNLLEVTLGGSIM